jgi:sulfur carrier protein
MIKVSLNNEQKLLPQQSNLHDAITLWQFINQKIAVAINGEFIPRASYSEYELKNGDKIDIVTPVGGG